MHTNVKLISPHGSDKRAQQSLVDAAANYVSRGWSVIPLHGKRPAIASWKEFQTRMPTKRELGAWFESIGLMPTGVGVVTGALSGLVVVDCDSPETVDYWLSEFPPSPVMVRTGRGGAHLYYQMPLEGEARNRSRIHGRSIDVRGEGGYVAAPPSLHPSGATYTWCSAGSGTSLPLLDLAWIAPLSVSIENSCSLQQVTSFRNVVAYISRIHAVSGERGHDATFRAACKLRDAGLSKEESLTVLREWNLTNAHPGWSHKELTHKISSAFRSLTNQ